MQHRDKIVLEKIISEIDIAMDIIGNKTFTEFENSEILKRSVCMTAINIGELVKGLSSKQRTSSNHIPWKKVAGFRDIAAHKYATLDMQDVFNSVVYDFPKLKEDILELLQYEKNHKPSLSEQIKAAETKQTQNIQQKEKDIGFER